MRLVDNIIIVSDDLTGANDSGVQFAKHGIPTVVCIDDCQLPDPASEGTACVINVESRSLSPEEAYRKWGRLLESIDLSSYQIVFKKIDSTLRGNVGKEIQACMETGLFKAAIVVPAYPQKGRKTVGGYQLVHQQLLEDSEISRDPKFPVKHSKVSEIIRRQWNCSIGEIEISTIRSGAWLSQLEALQRAGENVVVFDSATEDDIKQIVAELSGQRVLWVGAAGLAEALAGQYPRQMLQTVQPTEGSGGPPVLVMAGSVSAVTLGQVECLKQDGFESLLIDPLIFLDEANGDKGNDRLLEIETISSKAKQCIASGKSVVISTDVSAAKRNQVQAFLQESGIGGMDGGDRIADGMGKLAAAIMSQGSLAGAVLTGGDIAYRTCKHLGVRSLRIIDEVEEGLPLCLTEGAWTMPIVTKAGAFGHRHSMLIAARAIRSLGHSPMSGGGVADQTGAQGLSSGRNI
ncbi:four-carbon acid sugar kinase family protein [Paenibacillus validus]|uniref:four-carbon acid sugar kinase family protein n=1 Tax=Paenibacillus validus TaxID=44253 RepID=UPI003D2AF77B